MIEALSTATEDGGGYLQRHMMRRYELPPQADLQKISVELDERSQQLRVTIPSVKPKASQTDHNMAVKYQSDSALFSFSDLWRANLSSSALEHKCNVEK